METGEEEGEDEMGIDPTGGRPRGGRVVSRGHGDRCESGNGRERTQSRCRRGGNRGNSG